MKKVLLLTLSFALFAGSAFSQTDKAWSANTESRSSIIPDKGVARLAYPKDFKLFNLNIDPLRTELFSIVDGAAKRSAIISLPNADGTIERFEVWEASNFVPELQAAYPQIRAYSGRGITDKYATLKLSISPQGIATMVFRVERENEFMEPYSKDHTVYSVYKSQREKNKLPWVCSTVDTQLATSLNASVYGSNFTTNSDGILRTARLAQSCNGEYSNFFGATPANHDTSLVYAAFNVTLTRCNGCYEKDLALHLNLISNFYEGQIIFFDPATDPYTTLGAWNGQLQNLLNTVVGDPNYDIGHMFGASGGGGNAGCIGCICVSGTKGSGITSPADGIPMGDNFDIDYVVHEVGHQLGGNHSFTHSNEGTVAQKEVGAGITIMGYAGITSYDPAPHSIDIYHEANIAQIQANLATKACPTTLTMTVNHAPVVASVPNYTIPMQTPFALTGSATDPEGDPLTYCWEQNDVHGGQTGANSVAYAAKPTGPNFLSFSPTVSPTRFFPRLSTILAGLQITPPLPGGDAICNIEALSNVSRTETFRLTVRDNNPYVPGIKIGQTSFTDMTLTISNTSGPFQVTSPNTNVSWPGGSSQTITWNVNNTTAAPVSCANVKISLSTDAGLTFPTVILASTPNDGSELVTIPAGVTTTARIKIEAVGNIFFDISNTNFSITASNPTFDFVPSAGTTVTCASASAAITLQTTSILGFVTPINLVATGNPAGTNVTYSANPVIPGNSTIVTLNNMSALAPGTYNVTITGTAGAEIKTIVLPYIVSPGAGPGITAQPGAQTLCAGGTTSFSITSAAATSFQWQESTSGAGGPWNNITNGGIYGGANTATLTLTGITAGMNNYQYRCVAGVICGSTNSNAALLTVQTAPSISSQPANSTVCGAVGPTTFSINALGTNLTYQWQVSVTGCAGPWVNLANGAPYSGVTTPTMTITVSTPAMNGYAYRCLVSGTCAPAATSACGLLTVNTAVAVTTEPINSVICAGANTSFTVAASGTTPAYQWQESTNGGANWNNITNGGIYGGATTVTLTLTGVTAGMNTYQYRAVVNGAAPCGSANSIGAVLTVNTAPAITTQPIAATTLCVGGNTTYTVAANGTALTYQWQVSTTGAGGPWNPVANGGVYSGATTASLTLTGVTAAMTTYQYRCIVSGTCTPAATSSATALTVNTPINVTTQPATTSICATGSTNFTVAVSGTTPTYQWQLSTTGAAGPWTNITNGGIYAGATSTTLTLTGITAAMNLNQYRAVVTGAAPCGAVNSSPAVLNVTPLPVISASSTSLLAGQSTTLTVNVTPAPGLTFSWFLNGVLLPNATSNSIIATVNELGDYRVVVTSATGSCTSDLLNITATPSSKLFIFPSPNTGLFKVSYYTAGASATSPTKQSIVIYDSYGRLVLNKEYPVSQAYQLHQIDLRRNGAGVYYVVLREANGNKIKTGEVVIK